jgi:ankyrin repeat protein
MYNKSSAEKTAERAAKKQKKSGSTKKNSTANKRQAPFEYSTIAAVRVQEPIVYKPERYRPALMSLFHETSHQFINSVPELISAPPVDLDINITIDRDGNTTLYWAAALGRAHLIEAIIKSVGGSTTANSAIQNIHGETGLMGSVQATSSYDSQTFSRIVYCLSQCLLLVDSRKRSVLHHIVIAASKTTGKSGLECENIAAAARYYMECVLERIALTSQDFTFIDLMDQNGDTALNIAARIGCRNLTEQLINVGASPHLENCAGLRPVDFGLEIEFKDETQMEEFEDFDMMQYDSEYDPIVRDVYDGEDDGSAEEDFSSEIVVQEPLQYIDTISDHHLISHFGMDDSRLPNCPEEAARQAKGKQVVQAAKESRSGQSSSFSARVVFPALFDAAQMAFAVEQTISSGVDGRIEQTRIALNEQLQGKGQEMAHGKSKYHNALLVIQGMVNEMKYEYNVEMASKMDLLNEAQSNLREAAKNLAQLRKANSIIKAENQKIPSLMLRIQNLEQSLSQEIGKKYSAVSTGPERESLAVHKQVEESLRQEILSLKSQSLQSEVKFRKVIGSCAGIPDDSVDEMMDSLVAAIESDEACRVNVCQLSDFMTRVKGQEYDDLSLREHTMQ